MHELAAKLGDRTEHALEPDRLATQAEQPLDLLTCQERIQHPLLHPENPVLDGLYHRQITVDEVVQNAVENVVGTQLQELGRFFELFAKLAVTSVGSVTDRDDVMRTNEDRCLSILDHVALQVGGFHEHEELVIIDVELGNLLSLQSVLDGYTASGLGGITIPKAFGGAEVTNVTLAKESDLGLDLQRIVSFKTSSAS